MRLNLNMNDDDHELDDFSVRFNEVDARIEDDTIKEAIVAAESLLREPGLPFYVRLRIMAMMANLCCALKDWYKAEYIRQHAERLWDTFRRLYPIGGASTSTAVENEIQKVRGLLDLLRVGQAEDAPAFHRLSFLEDGEAVYEGLMEGEDFETTEEDDTNMAELARATQATGVASFNQPTSRLSAQPVSLSSATSTNVTASHQHTSETAPTTAIGPKD